MSEQLINLSSSTRGLVWQISAATFSRFLLNTTRRFPYTFTLALSRGLGVPLDAITWLIAVNQATGLLSPFFGSLSDRWGYRAMLLVSLGLSALGMLAGGLLPFYGVVMLALFLAGLGKCIFDPALQAYIGKTVPYERRGMVIGIVELGWSGSSLIGLPLVGWLIQRAGWQSPFLVLGGLTLLATMVLAICIPVEDRRQPTLEALPNFRETWQVVRGNRVVLGILACSFLIGLANDNFSVIYGAWLEGSFALSLVVLGATSSVIGAAELIGEGMTAFLSDRFGLKRSIICGLALSALGYLLLPLLGQSTLPLALTALFIAFLTFEFAVVTLISLTTEVLPSARATMMASLMATMSLGRVIGALAGGSIWLAGGLAAIGLVSALTTALGLFWLWWGLRHWQRGPQTLAEPSSG